ncbi:unnamed protein product [Lymnaea stagnalis]|uniref:Large ribosomal subunit protein uL22m n=1 Tax=Lymnaea stagnalis TaxID=6523 RepID=A0AAV2HDT1_LYMST
MATFRGISFARLAVSCFQQNILKNIPLSRISSSNATIRTPQLWASLIHSSSSHASYRNTDFEDPPKKIGKVKLVPPNWLKYNDVVYPPTSPGEPERPAEICHHRMQIKYGTKKMWYLACMIRGMSIDEAIKQLSFHKRKGAAHLKEALEEAQEIAVRDHNVEFKSNLWISDSFVTRGIIVKGYRRHARGRYGIIQYRYTNFFVRLREGRPPKDYYPAEKTGNELMEDYIKKQRARRIEFGL